MSATCHVCDGEAIPISEVREYTIGRRSAVVQDEFMRCPACAEEFYLAGQMDAVQRRASAAIREEEGLLLPEEIRAIREGLGLSQADFERLLGVGPKTVVRWEKGTVFQNKATDALLRLLNADRENVRRLCQWHQGVPSIRQSGTMSRVPIEELLQLSVAERIQLVEDLWDSIAADPEAEALVNIKDAIREYLAARDEKK